ncbi:MAG: MlaD family protein [Gemmataceae bacterium]|jgi:ABC-type transporter Mla subunit MlaD|nr:MlaD family protein [Gemmataceae bacterium]
MTERILRQRVGLFVAAGLAILGGLVLFFGRTPEWFSSKVPYVITYPEAPDIVPGTPIRKSGVRIGEVRTVELDPETGEVQVHIRVDRRYLPRKSEEAFVSRGILSGDTSIEFVPKLDDNGKPVPRGEVWPPGSVIPGTPPITARSLLTPASGVLSNAQQSLDRIVAAFEKLERLERLGPKVETALDEFTLLARDARGLIPELRNTARRLQSLIGAEEPPPIAPRASTAGPLLLTAWLQQPPPPPGGQAQEDANLKALIKDIQELVRAVRPAAEELRGMIRKLEPEVTATVKSARQAFDEVHDVLNPENRKQLAELIKNINTVSGYVVRISTSLTNLLETAEKTLRNIDQQITAAGAIVGDIRAVTRPLAARAEAIVASVSDSAEQLNRTLAEVRTLVRLLSRDEGTLQKLLVDPSVYQNLDAAAHALARVMTRAEKISRDLEVFADKVARRPELIGLGGVFRPSAGLKEWPPAPVPPAATPASPWPPSSAPPRYRPEDSPLPLPPQPPASILQPPAPPPPIQGYPPR